MAEDALPPVQVDARREMALLRAAQAPLVFFEVPTTWGIRNGIANITLEGGMHLLFDGKSIGESSVMGHLRFPLSAIPALRQALDQIELLAQPVPDSAKN